jgi:hypothetical protein
MAMGVTSEVSQNIFELQKEKPNKNETRREQTCPKGENPPPLPNLMSSSFLITYFEKLKNL